MPRQLYSKLAKVSFKHFNSVRNLAEFYIHLFRDLSSMLLLGTVRKRKLQWFGHLVRQDNSLAKMIMERMVEGKRRKRQTRETVDR